MPDPNSPPEPDDAPAPPADAGSQIDDTQAEALLGAAQAPVDEAEPLPTVLSGLSPEELYARGMGTAKATGAASGMWQPPSVEEAARLFPGYEVLGLLGRGGMGAVYKARQIELDRLVAIKLLPLEISADADFAERFRREARAMAKLNHPNIITVHEFGRTSEGHLFFAMEFVDGANLHAIIHGPGLEPGQALALTIQVCEALAFAHEQGVVHRDIKPANVMVDQRGRAKVADFGLARLTDSSAEQMGHTMTGTVMGTPDYMAPEQMKGMNVDHRADIYSLGVMLYEMLCKDVPRGIFDPPSHRVNGVDARIDQVVIKAMQQQPDRRYQQTGEMRTDVDQIRATLVAPSPSMVAAVASGTGRQRAVAAASRNTDNAAPSKPRKSKLAVTLAIAAAVLVLGALAFVFTRPAKPAAKKSEAAASPPLEPGAIRLFDTPESVGLKNGGAKLQDGVLVLGGPNGGSVGYGKTPSRDSIYRVSIRANLDAINPTLRVRAQGAKGSDEFYKLNLLAGKQEIELYYGSKDKEAQQLLKKWKLPRPYGPDEWVPIEWRAVDDEFTVSVDGQVLGSVRDDRLMKAGSVAVFCQANGYFRDIVYVPLDKPGAATSATAPLEPGAIKLWDTPAKIPKAAKVRWEDGALVLEAPQILFSEEKLSRDGIVRASFPRNAKESDRYVGVRAGRSASGRFQSYRVAPDFEKGLVVLHCEVGTETKFLKGWRLPRAVEPNGWIQLELRVVGDEVTVSADGQVVGTFRDSTLTEPGGAILWGHTGDAFRDIVYVPLDKSVSIPAPAATAATSAGWQSLFTDEARQQHWPGKREWIDGSLHLILQGLAAESSFADGAIRARIRFKEDSRIVGVMARARNDTEGYKLNISAPTHVSLGAVPATGKNIAVLGRYDFPKPLEPGEVVDLELRVQGDRLTGLVNGVPVIEARDTRFPDAGLWRIQGNDGWFESAEVQTLAAPAVAGTAPLEPGAIRLFDTPESVGLKNGGAKLQDGVLILGGANGGSVGYGKTPSRDAIYRASVRTTPELKNFGLRIRHQGNQSTDPFYLLGPGPGPKNVVLYYGVGAQLTQIKNWPLPRTYGASDWLRLEAHALGEEFTIYADGQKLGTVRDTRLMKPGGISVFASHAEVRDVVYVPLDKPSVAVATSGGIPASTPSPTAAHSAPSVKWEDLLKAGGWTAPWTIENGVLTRPAKAMAQRKWSDPVRDGAWRVTRRWDGGWFDLQLGLRSRGQHGLRLHFDQLPKPDVIQLVITGDDAKKLAFGQTKKRFQKGDMITVEFRAVGNEVTASIDGEIVATAKDELPAAGSRDIWSNYGEAPAIQQVQFLNLDGAVTPAAVSQESRGAASREATKDAPFVNTLGMKFVPVPITGGPTDKQRVLFSVWETRVLDYAAFANETKRDWPKAEFEQDPTHPAVKTIRDDATDFCLWLTERERKAGRLGAQQVYRLPTDHEWSCAAGIGDRENAAKQPIEKSGKIAGLYPWGTAWPPPDGAGNYAGEELQALQAGPKASTFSWIKLLSGYRDPFPTTAPVGSFAPNQFGLFDLTGNVWEWCQEQWGKGEANGVLRGGCWNDAGAGDLLLSGRHARLPDTRSSSYGFRVVLAPALP